MASSLKSKTIKTLTGDVYQLTGGEWKVAKREATTPQKPNFDAAEYIGQIKDGSENVNREGSIKSQWYAKMVNGKAQWVEAEGEKPMIGYDITKSKFAPEEVLRPYAEATNESFLRNYVTYMMMKREIGGYVLRWNGDRLYNTDGSVFRLNTRFPSEALATFTAGWPRDIAFDGILYIPYETEVHFMYVRDEIKKLYSKLVLTVFADPGLRDVMAALKKARIAVQRAGERNKGESQSDFIQRGKAAEARLENAKANVDNALAHIDESMQDENYELGSRFMQMAMKRFKEKSSEYSVNVNLLESYAKLRAYVMAIGTEQGKEPEKFVKKWPDMEKTAARTEADRDIIDFYQDAIHTEIRELAAALTDDSDKDRHDLGWSIAKFQVVDLWSIDKDTPFVKRYEILRKRILPLQEHVMITYEESDSDSPTSRRSSGSSSSSISTSDFATPNVRQRLSDLRQSNLPRPGPQTYFSGQRRNPAVGLDSRFVNRNGVKPDPWADAEVREHAKQYTDLLSLEDASLDSGRIPRMTVNIVKTAERTTLELATATYINSVEQAQLAIYGALKHNTINIIDPDNTRSEATTAKIRGIPRSTGPIAQERAQLYSGMLQGFKFGEKADDALFGRLKYFKVQSAMHGEVLVEIPESTLPNDDMRKKPKEYFPVPPDGYTTVYFARKIEGDIEGTTPMWVLDSIEFE